MKGKVRLLGYAFLVASVAYIIFLWSRPPLLAASADEFASAVYLGQVDQMLDFASDSEIQCGNLDTAKVRAAREILLGDRLRRSKFVSRDSGVVTSEGTQGIASITLIDKSDDSSWGLIAIMNKADGGPKTTLLLTMLTFSYVTPEEIEASGSKMLAQARKYRSRLEEIGISKMLVNPSRCETWDDWDKYLSKRVDLKRKRQAGTPTDLGKN